jgi:hypothetical protein
MAGFAEPSPQHHELDYLSRIKAPEPVASRRKRTRRKGQDFAVDELGLTCLQ